MAAPLRIVLDARHLQDFGIGTYIRNLLQGLAGIDRVNQYFLAGEADCAQLVDLPDNFHWVPYGRRDSNPLDDIRFPLFLRQFSPDLCHIPLNTVSVFLPRPYVVTIHDMGSLIFPRHGGVQTSLWEFRFRRGLLRASKVIAVSKATRKDVERLLRIPPDRIRQIYSALDPQYLAPPHENPRVHEEARRRVLERYSINYPFVLYAGKIRPQKNVARLVEAFAVVRADLASHPVYRELRLIIIGDELSTHPEVRRAVIQSRVEQHVRFLGFVSTETLRHFYESASLFAFPSLYEGFGLPPLEAMACGTPVVTSNVSSLPEVVGNAAVMVDPRNVFEIARALEEVLLNETLREDLKERGRRQVQTFSWQRTASEVLDTYLQVASAKR